MSLMALEYLLTDSLGNISITPVLSYFDVFIYIVFVYWVHSDRVHEC